MLKSFLIVSIFLVQYAITGGIKSYGLDLDYSNIGMTSKYTLTFELETSQLDEERDCLRITFPQAIHDKNLTLESQISSVIITTDSSSIKSKNMRVDSIGRYYFYFGITLQAQVITTLLIQAKPLEEKLQQSLLTSKLIVEVESIMDYTSDTSFVYDFNSVFAILSFTNPPEKNLQLSVEATVSEYAFKPGGIYPVFFTIVTSKNYYGRMLFEVSYIPEGFQLSQFCYSIKGQQISAIEPSLYSCTFREDGVLLFDYFMEYIPQGFAFRLSTMGTNAKRVEKNVGFSIRAVLKDSAHVTDEVSLPNLFDLEQIYLSKTAVTAAFGIPLDTQMSPNFLTCLIRCSDSSQGHSSIFNSVKFIFQVSEDTPTSQELELRFFVPTTGADSYVLLHSIGENLPSIQDSIQVNCSIVNNQKNQQNRFIRCQNVGQLSSGVDYHIGFRILLGYDSLQPNLPNNFSELQIMTVSVNSILNAKQVDILQLNINQQLVKNVVRTLNSNNWSYGNYNQTVISTQEYDPILKLTQFKRPYMQGGILGIVPSNLPQKLIFSLDIPNSQLTDTDMSISQEVPNGAGVMVGMNTHIQFSNPTDLNSYSLLNSNITHHFNYSSNIFTLLTVAAKTTDSLSRLFTRNDFSLSSAIINFRSSPYPSDQTLDFYIITYDQILSSNPIPIGQILVNAYTIDPSYAQTDYQLAIINHYKSFENGNQPHILPTLLKVALKFSSIDISSQDQAGFAIFFSGASFAENPTELEQETKPLLAECGHDIAQSGVQFTAFNTFKGNQTHPINPGLILTNMNVLVISNLTLSSNQWTSIVLPIQLSSQSDEYQVYMAILQTSSDYKSLSKTNYYSYQKIYRLSGSSMNNIETPPAKRRLIFGNNLLFTDNFPSISNFKEISTSSMSLSIDNLRVGDTSKVEIDIQFTDTNSKYSYVNDNEQTYLQGSAFTLVASWQFYVSSQSQNNCLFFQMKLKRKYVMYCPLSTSNTNKIVLDIANFILPSNALETPSDTLFCISNQKGYLRLAKYNQQSIKLQNVLNTIISQSKLFWNSQDNLLTYILSQPNSAISLNVNMRVRLIPSFSRPYIIFGEQCLFYYPSSKQYDSCSTYIDPSYNFIDFFINQATCTICEFSSTFQILHYNNQVIDASILSTTDLQDKSFSMSLCIALPNNSCQVLASSVSPLPSYTFEVATIISPKKLNIKSSSLDFSPQSFNIAGIISLKFGFTTSKLDNIYFNANVFNKIILDLGTFGINNPHLLDVNVMTKLCSIYEDTSDTVQGNQFILSKSFGSITQISSSTNASLLLNLKRDLSDISQFILQCSNVIFPSSALILPITLTAKDFTFSTIIDQFKDYKFDTPFPSPKSMAYGYPLLTSIKSNYEGLLSSFIFKLKTFSKQPLTNMSIFILSFPFNFDVQYNPTFPLSCQINSMSVDCFIESRNKLRVSSIPQQDQNLFQFSVSGVRLPSQYEHSIFSFVVYFDSSDRSIYEEGFTKFKIESLIPSKKPLPLIVSSMILENNLLDNLSSYSFYLQLNSSFISPNTQFQINFPSAWKLSNEENSSSCFIKDEVLDTILGQFCRKEGSTVTFKVYSSSENIAGGYLSFIQLYISNINNPETWDSNDKFAKPLVSLIDEKTGMALMFGESYLVNIQNPKFYQEKGRIQLGWFNENGKQIYEITAAQGLFTGRAYLCPIDKSVFKGPLSIQMITKTLLKVKMYPHQSSSNIGDQNLVINIGGDVYSLEGKYLATFYKYEDTFNIYGNVPSLTVYVITQKLSLPLSISKVKIPKSGESPPIIIDLSKQRVMTPIVVRPIEDERITIIFGKSMYFDSYTESQIFQFKLADDIQQSSISINFSVSGSGSKFISQKDSIISVEIDILDYQGTTLSISSDLTKSNSTNYGFNFICNNPGIIYYRFSQKYEGFASVQDIKSKSIIQYQNIQENYKLKERYGFALFNQLKAVQIVANGLLSSTDYKVEAFCQTYKGDSSEKQIINFQTTDNKSYLGQFSLIFQSNLNEIQKRKLCCALSEFMTIPPNLIYLREGISCKLSQMRTNFVSTISKQLLYSKVQKDKQEVIVYLSPLLYLQDVNSLNYIMEAINNQNNFNSVLQNTLEMFPQLLTVSEITYLNPQTVTFNLTNPDLIKPTLNSVTISNLLLNTNGFIYVALEQLSAQSVKPVVNQLKRGVNYQGTVFKHGMQVAYQNSNLYHQPTFNFEHLESGTQYIIYFMGGSEHLEDLTTFTEIFTRQFQTDRSESMSKEDSSHSWRCRASIIFFYLIFGLFL